MGAGSDDQIPKEGRALWRGCRQSVDRHIKGAPGPGGCGTCAGCTWTGLLGFGRAGTGSTDWPLVGTLECFLCPIQKWATGWTIPASPGSLLEEGLRINDLMPRKHLHIVHKMHVRWFTLIKDIFSCLLVVSNQTVMV